MTDSNNSCTAFEGTKLIFSGPLGELPMHPPGASSNGAFLLFNDATGRVIDPDLRASVTEAEVEEGKITGRGRPKLGVVSREVTLLPRQWDWLALQQGGISATLRKLVDDARKNLDPVQKRRGAQTAAYQFMHAIAGDMPGYEEATRALFADDQEKFLRETSGWPEDVRDYALRLGFSPS